VPNVLRREIMAAWLKVTLDEELGARPSTRQRPWPPEGDFLPICQFNGRVAPSVRRSRVGPYGSLPSSSTCLSSANDFSLSA
jgi:hypothetical protein